ncbi:MAG: SUMF1/EgtB/PvdO family nonheme iron enzyme, partial [Thermoanaerobaculia bacterium]
RLEEADLILLLVSSSFIASDYCWDVEATRALERHARGEAQVVPILVRPCEWETAPFAEIQGLPKNFEPVSTWDDRDRAWLDVARGLRQAITVLRAREDGRQPLYADDESRALSGRLKELYERRKQLTIAGDDTRALEGEILDVRRLLRKGPQLRPGELLLDGRYELVEVLGQGGFATVWKSWDAETDRLVALKVLHGHYSDDRSRRQRFFRGARKMADLVHPHIVRVLESRFADDGWHFYVMEYLTGGNFEQAVLAGRLTAPQRLQVVLEVGEALAFAHRSKVVHRDVKPTNVLLDAELRAQLTDFDLVRAEDTTGLTRTQAMMGTIQFAAPEALEAAGQAGVAADVYSLGSTAVFAVSGERLPALYYRRPEKVIAGLACGDELKGVLTRATAFAAAERPATVEDFCRAFRDAAEGAGRPRRVGGPVPDLSGASWAKESGTDKFGPWATVDVDGVTFRMRWIPAGRFLMGSPEGEQGRYSDEGPQHEVNLTRDFWLAETPCTQTLWETVTGKNPSHFKSPDRPVETVSWGNCREFLKALNERIPGLEMRLPSEAEWEYACRAGTETSTYAGELEILESGKAPLLDSIAWYYGNSSQGTQPVAQKDPNRWGLYGMLGNVWEWCSDWIGSYGVEAVEDPTGPGKGAERVFRGGAWIYDARRVRCASRNADVPGIRYDSLGFRLARGQGEGE